MGIAGGLAAILSVRRDPRVDVLRGAALLMIFIDHVPGNRLGFLTLHVWGYADAAEVFVLFAGFASMLAYGKSILREGWGAGLRKIGARCVRLYSVQALLFLLTVVAACVWSRHFETLAYPEQAILQLGWRGVAAGLALYALPSMLDILPLYLVLLAAFPLIFLGLKHRPWLTMAGSVAVWTAAANVDGLDLPNMLDPGGWYFDPLSWQLVFVLGAALALILARRPAGLPSRPWLTVLCVGYLLFGVLQVFPYEAWGLPSWRPLGDQTPLPDKSHVGVLRVLGALAWVQIIFREGAGRWWVRGPVARLLESCGRHSLPVFGVGCALALVGRLLMATFGEGLAMQVGVNVVGLWLLLTLGCWLDRRRDTRSKQLSEPRHGITCRHGRLSECTHLVADRR